MSAREAYRRYEQTGWPGSTTQGRSFGARLAVGVAFAIAIALGSFCALAWVNNEDVVAWSLSRGLVSEASAGSLYGGLRYAYVATATAGLMLASLAVGTVRRAISATSSQLRAVIAMILRCLWGYASTVARGGLLTLGYAGGVARVVAGYVRSGVAAVAKGTGAVAGYVWTYFHASLAYAWAVVSRPLRYVWLGIAAVATAVAMSLLMLWVGGIAVARGVAFTLRWVRSGAVAAVRPIREWTVDLARAVVAGMRLARVSLTAVAETVGFVAGLARPGVRTAAGFLGLAIYRIICLLWRDVSAVGGTVGFVAEVAWLGVRTAAGFLGFAIYRIICLLWRDVSAVAGTVGLTSRYMGHRVRAGAGYLGLVALSVVRAVSSVMLYVLGPFASAFRDLSAGLSAVVIHLWRVTFIIALAAGASMHYVRVVVESFFGMLWLGLLSLAQIFGLVLAVARLRSNTVLRYARLGGATTFGVMAAVTKNAWRPVPAFLGYVSTGTTLLACGIGTVLRGIWVGASAVGSHLWLGVSIIRDAVGTAFHPLRLAASATHHHLRLGVATAFLVVGWMLTQVGKGMRKTAWALIKSPVVLIRTIWTGLSVGPDVWRAAGWKSRRRKGAFSMSDFKLTRERLLSLVVTVLVFFTIGSVSLRLLWPSPPEPTVTVVHWSTGHLTRDGLLKDMARQFNEAGHRTGSSNKIVVEVYDAPSELQGKYLSELLRFGTRRDLNQETNGYVVKDIPDPTIVTPSSAHWLVTVNYEVGRPVVDLEGAESIVRPVIGIVTYEAMAKCLGWPEKEIGFSDIIALRNDPRGWASYPCARAEWGQTPLLAFTDPTTSSTGRSLHLALYSIAAKKSPEDLTIDDVNDPEVVAYVKEFQGLIDHYLIGTTVLNTKIYQGPRYGHFFVMPEDNLIHLYEGTEKAYVNGVKTQAPRIEERMVMIYPKEGSMPRKNCACIVQADWVSEEQVEASRQWIDFIRKDEQQRAFMAAGFRPGTDLDLNYPGSKISSKFGLNPAEPKVVLNPSRTRPEVAAAIDENWELVKRPGIVTFVVDTSGSMLGDKLRQAKDGLVRALGSMARNNQVGLITFDDTVNATIPVAPLSTNRFAVGDAIHEMRARGETALYDAIRSGIQMTDAAEGDAGAIRAVVVLTDGQANKGSTELDDIIQIMSRAEVPIRQFGGMVDEPWALDARGTKVAKQDVVGIGQAMETDQPIQIFYIGIGDDADMDVGRLLAGATGAEFQGVAEQDLASLLEEISGYF